MAIFKPKRKDEAEPAIEPDLTPTPVDRPVLRESAKADEPKSDLRAALQAILDSHLCGCTGMHEHDNPACPKTIAKRALA